MLVDTHAHLNMTPLYERWQEVWDRAQAAGVTQIIVPGASIETSRRGIEIAKKAKEIWAAGGVHPERLNHPMDVEAEIAELERLIEMADKKVVAIGECGLDYHYRQDNKKEQQQLFKLQVELAKKHDLPIIIHTRESEAIEDARQIVGEYRRCVYHCFSGDKNPGTYVGIGGTITYKGNEKLQELVAAIPIEQIILETDAPWLSPTPLRGTTNTPENVAIVAIKLAELKEMRVSQIMKITSENARKLFGI